MTYFTENHNDFDENNKKRAIYQICLTIYIYIYISQNIRNDANVPFTTSFFWEEQEMRIILDTDKKTITVPWNYQRKLDELNDIILAATEDETK